MRKKPAKSKKDIFIESAPAHDIIEKPEDEDIYRYVIKKEWPIHEETLMPSLSKGSSLNKPLSLPLKEYEWHSIDKHTKSLGVQKSEWIRYAIFRLMKEEQDYFLNKK